MNNAAIIATTGLVAAILFHPRLSDSKGWRATVTPLASIIGSGFLVIGPILDASFGYLAPIAMAALCTVAILFGAAIRRNIARIAEVGERSVAERVLDRTASWVLATAYAVSVAYYLNLLGAFSVSLTAHDDPATARIVATAALLFIAFIGWTRGFSALEGLEKISVSLKLAIIAGLLLGLGIHFGDRFAAGDLILNPIQTTGWNAVWLIFGLLVTVQGFETSRYLGEDYDPQTRIASMSRAQWVSAGIYMVYILLLSFLFPAGTIPQRETAIISLMELVAPVLPALLVSAALAAQFSAAVADTAGSGGLLHELTGGKIAPRTGYVLLAGISLVLTWSANVFEIITIASRAFAGYYALQSAVAAAGYWISGRVAGATGFAALGVLGVLIAFLGMPFAG